eukprot:COSAG02_NODE_1857_length_10645_cov_24.485302_5_plen_98_part_00
MNLHHFDSVSVGGAAMGAAIMHSGYGTTQPELSATDWHLHVFNTGFNHEFITNLYGATSQFSQFACAGGGVLCCASAGAGLPVRRYAPASPRARTAW